MTFAKKNALNRKRKRQAFSRGPRRQPQVKKRASAGVERVVEVMEGVNITVKEREILVKGPKGELKRDFDDPRFNSLVKISQVDNKVQIVSKSDKRRVKAVVGTINKHITNMMLGVTSGFKYKLKVHYSHFPISLAVQGSEVHIKNFIGEKGARVAHIIGDTKVKPGKDDVILTGISLEDVSQTAANIEQACNVSKRDRRIFQDGVYLSEKSVDGGK